MDVSRLGVVLLAFAAGACGSFMTTLVKIGTGSAAPAGPSRANRFELVDETGRPRWRLELASGSKVRMRFLDNEGRSQLELGAGAEGDTYLVMNGRDERMRVRLRLMGMANKPILEMGDDRWDGRLGLGVSMPDDGDPDSDVWGLFLGNPIDLHPLAQIGMVCNRRQPEHGFVGATGRAGGRWAAALEE